MASNSESPDPKMKNSYSKKEALEKLKECENNVSQAVDEMVSDLSPFDVTNESVKCVGDRIDRLDKLLLEKRSTS